MSDEKIIVPVLCFGGDSSRGPRRLPSSALNSVDVVQLLRSLQSGPAVYEEMALLRGFEPHTIRGAEKSFCCYMPLSNFLCLAKASGSKEVETVLLIKVTRSRRVFIMDEER